MSALNGLLLVDKPVGIAFASVIKAVRRKFDLVKVGHGGSLDAMASGLFIVLVNDATRLGDQIMGADRAYEGTMRLGLKTNTHDIHGETLAEGAGDYTSEQLAKALAECRGDIFQTEPRFCSIRKEGTADYEIADTGEHKPFLAHVYRFAVEGNAFKLEGTKALIVRTLINDFGDLLGCGAALASLRRVRIGKFDVAQAMPFEKLLKLETGDLAGCLMPLSEALR